MLRLDNSIKTPEIITFYLKLELITRRLLMPDFLFTDNLYIRFDISSVCHYILSECFIYCS